MINDIIINKVQTIKRCLTRINEEYNGNPKHLENYTKQDSIILNIQRACEASIDIAMHVISEKGWGVPQNSRDAFDILYKNGVINEKLNHHLKAMVGFRNIAVHDYQTLHLPVIQEIIEKHLTDFIQYTNLIMKYE